MNVALQMHRLGEKALDKVQDWTHWRNHTSFTSAIFFNLLAAPTLTAVALETIAITGMAYHSLFAGWETLRTGAQKLHLSVKDAKTFREIFDQHIWMLWRALKIAFVSPMVAIFDKKSSKALEIAAYRIFGDRPPEPTKSLSERWKDIKTFFSNPANLRSTGVIIFGICAVAGTAFKLYSDFSAESKRIETLWKAADQECTRVGGTWSGFTRWDAECDLKYSSSRTKSQLDNGAGFNVSHFNIDTSKTPQYSHLPKACSELTQQTSSLAHSGRNFVESVFNTETQTCAAYTNAFNSMQTDLDKQSPLTTCGEVALDMAGCVKPGDLPIEKRGELKSFFEWARWPKYSNKHLDCELQKPYFWGKYTYDGFNGKASVTDVHCSDRSGWIWRNHKT